jgi:hypothetical protein
MAKRAIKVKRPSYALAERLTPAFTRWLLRGSSALAIATRSELQPQRQALIQAGLRLGALEVRRKGTKHVLRERRT